MYLVQVYMNGVWAEHAVFTDPDMASRACYRAVFAYKAQSRVIGVDHGEILHERFYNIADDPDENWRDEVIEQHCIDWKEAGF